MCVAVMKACTVLCRRVGLEKVWVSFFPVSRSVWGKTDQRCLPLRSKTPTKNLCLFWWVDETAGRARRVVALRR